MITYVLMGNLFAVIVRNFIPGFVTRDITAGRLSMFLVKPMSYLKFIFFNELGRMFLALLISAISQLIVISFFLDKIALNTDARFLIVIICMLVLAFIIEMMIGFLIGTIAFWTDETEGLQTTIDRVKRFFAGGYFPLSLLPAGLAAASAYLPFTYSFFTPASLYLKKISLGDGVKGLGIQIIWILILSAVIWVVWKRGLRRYEATGS
jgi:ABC-2 type transport system permease protein